jgi:deoxyribonuclease V
MILAIDAAYGVNGAVVAGVLFNGWPDAKPAQELVISCPVPDSYLPGRFYRRELPCIAALLEHVAQSIDFIVIDGYVYLGRNREPGLGKRLRDMLEEKVVVIGVAKKPYRDTPDSCEVLRGKSLRPLYVTADGIRQERARFLISIMHGKGRIPTMLRYADRLCRERAFT